MLLILLGNGFTAGIVAALIVLINREDEKVKHSVIATIIASVVSMFLMWLVIVMALPTFAHWSDIGPTLGFYLALIVGSVFGTIEGYNSNQGWGENRNLMLWLQLLTILSIAFLRPVLIGYTNIGHTGPSPCYVNPNQAVLSQLLAFQPTAEMADDQESSTEKISDDRSLALAQGRLPAQLNLGEAFVVGYGNEQLIGDKPINVHPLRIKDKSGGGADLAAYERFGNQTPGYVVVDSSRTDGFAQWVSLPPGQEIRYIYNDAFWKEYNLERYVYFHYSLPKRVQVWDLDGPEITDDFQFWYVGTVMKPSRAGGARYYMPAGIITINAHSGEIREYTIQEATEQLPWLDRILPINAAANLVKAYARYRTGAKLCNLFSDSGQWEVDDEPVIATRGGEQVLQFFVTTLNDDDPLIQEVIYVSPRTMLARKFPGNGMLVTANTRAMVESRANPSQRPENYSVLAKDPTHMWFGGFQYMVYILERRNNTFAGFGAIRSDLANKANDQYVLLAASIGELSGRALEQIATIKPGSLDNQAAQTSFELRVTGVVELIGEPYLDAGDLKVLFAVRVPGENGGSTLYVFRSSSRTLAESFVAVGHTVTITGQATSQDPMVAVEVSTLANLSYPPTAAPTWTGAPTPSP